MNLKYYILLLLSFLSTYWLYHHHFSVESNEDTMLLKKIWPSESSTVSSFMKKFVKQESSNKNLKK